MKFFFNILSGDLGKSFTIIAQRHEQIKNRIFTLTNNSNLDFARTGVCMTVPESHEDQINNLNKITVLKKDETAKGLKEGDLINDDFFSKRGVTKKDYDRMIELAVEAYMKTSGKLSSEEQEKIINEL